MNSKTKLKSNKNTFWKPEKVGESLTGKFECFSESNLGLVLQLNGCQPVGINSKPLYNAFKQIYNKLKVTDTIKIIYLGLGKHKIKDNFPRLYEVYLNGKIIEVPFEPVPMDSKEVNKFFENSKGIKK